MGGGIWRAAFAAAALAFASPAIAQQPDPSPPPTTADPQPAPSGPAPIETGPVVIEKPAPVKVHDAAEIDLSMIRTADMSLLYFDPAQTYLTPYIARSFEHSMEFQRRIFGWRPWERTTVLLKDFSDYGNAGARSSPNNTILLDVAPLPQTFETFSAGERFFTMLNHEPVHVATMDVWNETDARWRRLFHGKPMPIEDHPESILYNFLATPRVNAPRWYM
jgi:hypothetical protein